MPPFLALPQPLRPEPAQSGNPEQRGPSSRAHAAGTRSPLRFAACSCSTVRGNECSGVIFRAPGAVPVRARAPPSSPKPCVGIARRGGARRACALTVLLLPRAGENPTPCSTCLPSPGPGTPPSPLQHGPARSAKPSRVGTYTGPLGGITPHCLGGEKDLGKTPGRWYLGP